VKFFRRVAALLFRRPPGADGGSLSAGVAEEVDGSRPGLILGGVGLI